MSRFGAAVAYWWLDRWSNVLCYLCGGKGTQTVLAMTIRIEMWSSRLQITISRQPTNFGLSVVLGFDVGTGGDYTGLRLLGHYHY